METLAILRKNPASTKTNDHYQYIKKKKMFFWYFEFTIRTSAILRKNHKISPCQILINILAKF